MGDYFSSKEEAVAFYKGNFKNLEDKPDWLVEGIIEFCIKYPDYKEYIGVEHKIKSNIELSEYEKKTYGDLDWNKKLNTYKKNEVIYDAVDIKDYGEYDDIARDEKAREKLNKYNLDFGKSLEPSKEVQIRMSNKDETTVFKALVDDLNEGIRDKWTIEKE
jgi:hypothetical protein